MPMPVTHVVAHVSPCLLNQYNMHAYVVVIARTLGDGGARGGLQEPRAHVVGERGAGRVDEEDLGVGQDNDYIRSIHRPLPHNNVCICERTRTLGDFCFR